MTNANHCNDFRRMIQEGIIRTYPASVSRSNEWSFSILKSQPQLQRSFVHSSGPSTCPRITLRETQDRGSHDGWQRVTWALTAASGQYMCRRGNMGICGADLYRSRCRPQQHTTEVASSIRVQFGEKVTVHFIMALLRPPHLRHTP
jgi:hypothetical protein